MKKMLISVVCIVLVFSLTACGNNERQKQEIASMFESFDKAENIILLTCFDLVVNETHYDLDEIKYNGQQCHIVFLEENGFYSYTYNQDVLSVEFLYTLYEDFETISIGTEILPSEIINGFFADNCFWFRMDDPNTDEFKQMYYSWNVNTKEVDIVATGDISEDYEVSKDCSRSERYSFSYTSTFFKDYLDVTDNETNVTKRIDSSILSKFEEGKKIKDANSSTKFGVEQVFEDDGNIYLASFFGVDFLGDPCYCYVYKWNFETEECEFYTTIYFESYQEWVTDMYIK